MIQQCDPALITPLDVPERPDGKVKNGYLQDLIESLRDAIKLDNEKKQRLLDAIRAVTGS